MIIYKKDWLDHLEIIKQAERDQGAGYITPDELRLIRLKYPVGFYRPGIFALTGLFILTLFIVAMASGFLSLFIAGFKLETFLWPLILGLIFYAITEFSIRENNLFHSGVDNALLYTSASMVAGGFIWMFSGNVNDQWTNLLYAVIIFLLALLLTLRFADILTGLITCLSVFAIVFFGWGKAGAFGLATMPFVIMIAAAAVYQLILYLAAQPKGNYYKNVVLVIKIACLLVLYAAGNYLVVNRLNNQLNHLDDATHTIVPFGYIFWVWTFTVPAVYLYIGIIKKQRVFLRLAMLLVVAAVFTFRTYYHIFPTEIMLSIGGAILLGLSLAIVRYLKKPRHGFTLQEPDEKNEWDNLKIESLIIGESASHLPHTPVDNGYHFGGGSSGGGGSSSDF